MKSAGLAKRIGAQKHPLWSGAAVSLALFILAVGFFALSHPNILLPRGAAPAGWLAYLPVFLLIRRTTLVRSVFYGAAYGYAAYNLFGYWLAAFHPLAGIITGTLELFWFSLLFFLLKLVQRLLPRGSTLAEVMLWTGFEWLRTQGFAGYPYGLTAYSQWEVLPLIQIAGIAGPWAVSTLVLFPQCYIAALWSRAGDKTPQGILKTALFRREKTRLCPLSPRLWPFWVYLAVLIAVLVYGFTAPHDFQDEPQTKIALIQPNSDPWKGGIAEYRDNLRVLRSLSDAALQSDPGIELVVWPETAFVPRIFWHETYRDDPESFRLVRELTTYLASKPAPFLIGNDDARLEAQPSGDWERVDYNAAILFDQGRIVDQYRKMHLVPFTEYFPYEKQFPQIYAWLLAADTHFWKRGDRPTVFRVDRAGTETGASAPPPLLFSTPICFEDSFSDLSRTFVQNGANLIVNISNDAWSASLPAQYQHLSMAVFRAVENRRAMVRATASGQTCLMLPNGRVLREAAPFTENYLVVNAPLMEETTFYTAHGELVLFAALLTTFFLSLVYGIFCALKKKTA
ncbi:MAG: apolipoprotein N-acyltransferase [Spirochaetaceae bacterium]|nr:apolipoprotein N-acyltransferase [Spirochaetaceae bacterium]